MKFLPNRSTGGAKCLKALLPPSSDDQLALLTSFVKSSDPNFSFLLLSDFFTGLTPKYSQSESSFFRRKAGIKDFLLSTMNPELLKAILWQWSQEIASTNLTYFLEYLSFSDSSFLSKELLLEISSKSLLLNLLKDRSHEGKPFSSRYAVELAKSINLKEISHGDIFVFARVVGSNRKLANKVLKNVCEGTVG